MSSKRSIRLSLPVFRFFSQSFSLQSWLFFLLFGPALSLEEASAQSVSPCLQKAEQTDEDTPSPTPVPSALAQAIDTNGGWAPASAEYVRRVDGKDGKWAAKCNIERVPASVAYENKEWRPPHDRPIILVNFTSYPGKEWRAQSEWTKQNFAEDDEFGKFDFFVKVETVTELIANKMRLAQDSEKARYGNDDPEDNTIAGQPDTAYKHDSYVTKVRDYVRDRMTNFDDRVDKTKRAASEKDMISDEDPRRRRWYVFDRGGRIPEYLLEDFRPPPFFLKGSNQLFEKEQNTHGQFRTNGPDRICKATGKPPKDDAHEHLTVEHNWGHFTLALGTSGTGALFHKHGPAANTVLFGRKRWFVWPTRSPQFSAMRKGRSGEPFTPFWRLVPESRSRPDSADAEAEDTSSVDANAAKVSMERWVASKFGYRHPHWQSWFGKWGWECEQGPGEMMFIPGDFDHGVLNYGETVAVVAEYKVRFG